MKSSLPPLIDEGLYLQRTFFRDEQLGTAAWGTEKFSTTVFRDPPRRFDLRSERARAGNPVVGSCGGGKGKVVRMRVRPCVIAASPRAVAHVPRRSVGRALSIIVRFALFVFNADAPESVCCITAVLASLESAFLPLSDRKNNRVQKRGNNVNAFVFVSYPVAAGEHERRRRPTEHRQCVTTQGRHSDAAVSSSSG